MGCTNHKSPAYATRNGQTRLKSTVNTGCLKCGCIKFRVKNSATRLEPHCLHATSQVQLGGFNGIGKVKEERGRGHDVCKRKAIARMDDL